MFLEKLIDLFVTFWQQLAPFVVLDPYQGGVILRLGKYHRTIGPGLSWKIPVVESCIDVPTCITTMRLPPQTLTTRDGVGVVAACVVKYAIRDPQPYVTEILDQADVLADVTMGATLTAVAEMTYDDLRVALPERRVLDSLRKQVNRFGFRIESVTFTDFGRVRSFRLVTDHNANLNN